MIRRFYFSIGLIGLPMALIGLAFIVGGCDYSAKKKPLSRIDEAGDQYGPLPGASGRVPARTAVVIDPNSEGPNAEIDPEVQKRREIILANVMKLMQTAYINPGGRNFEIATENLNELFEQGTSPTEYRLSPRAADFLSAKIVELSGQDPAPAIKALSSPKWERKDARHIEDCMLYRAVAARISGEGDDLTRVRRIFDWLVRNVQLVPAESLSGPGFRQAQARPADVLMRGMATESGGWSERGWLFMALCRQINVDVGLLTLSPRRTMGSGQANPRAANSWICAAVVDGKAYLFDPRIGLEIAGPDGTGVATLEEAATIPEVLDRLELPGRPPYGISYADIAGSPTRVGVLVDSSPGYLAPRMRLLQGQLRGQDRTTLFRDPAEQAVAFAKALGPRYFGGVSLWSLPIQVEELLFSNPAFVEATIASLHFFDGKFPLLYARTAQLRGELVDATDKYVSLRFAKDAVMNDTAKQPISPEDQRALDIYATYFIAQCHLDLGNAGQAEKLFRQMLNMIPEPGGGRYFYYMLRRGALTNLGRLCETRGDFDGAIACYAQGDPTAQRHGNLLRARALVWKRPTADPVTPLPPAPPDVATPVKAAAR